MSDRVIGVEQPPKRKCLIYCDKPYIFLESLFYAVFSVDYFLSLIDVMLLLSLS